MKLGGCAPPPPPQKIRQCLNYLPNQLDYILGIIKSICFKKKNYHQFSESENNLKITR